MDKSFVQNRMMEYAKSSEKSMAEISKKMGREESYVSGAAKGRFEPKLSDVLLFCETLGIPPSEFFREEDLTLDQQRVCSFIRDLTPSQVRLILQFIDEFRKLNLLREI